MKLTALTLLAFVAVSLAWRDRESDSDRQWNDRKSPLGIAQPFKSGHVYKFRYESQVSSGLGSMDGLTSGLQQSTHRLSSWVSFNFESDRSATLRLEEIRVAALNGEIPEIRRVQPMQLFEDRDIDSEMLEQLQMPCRFEIVDGMVERIFFDAKDSTWSKNIKRAVLNMIHLNLKQRSTDVEGLERDIERQTSDDRTSTMFTLPEITLEGACQTVYTITKVSDEESREVYNVTKSIDFKQCKDDSKTPLPITHYGPRVEKPTVNSKLQDIEEQILDRSTVLRFQVVKTNSEKYAIGQTEVLSIYTYANFAAETQRMQTVVSSTLLLDSIMKSSETERQSYRSSESKEETLLYSVEWDRAEKRFYQYGDEEGESPFAQVPNKVKNIQTMITKLAKAATDKTHGIESEITLMLQQVVELIRMCSIEELKELHKSLESRPESELEIFTDALAIAGTHNTIKQLVHKINNREISTPRAVKVLRHLNHLPAISDKQVDIVLRLCKEKTVQDDAPLRQSCWLTVGSMIGEACKESVRDADICTRHKKDKYAKTLWEQYENADNLYEKVLALKAVGNAGIYFSVHNLEKLIVDRKIPATVRIQAIDALRRLRSEAPRKLQRILLPVFKSMDVPEVRMAAFSMLMHTIPDKAVLSSLGLHHERSNHVRSFVVSCMKSYASSPLEQERELAQNLRSLLTLARIDEDSEYRKYTRIPIYSSSGSVKEGLFVNWAGMFSTSDALPKHASLSIESAFNGILEPFAQVSASQNNIESIYHKLMDSIFQSERSSIRGRRSSRRNGEEELDTLSSSYKIQLRDAYEKNPFGLISIRVRDVDHVILPLGEEYMPKFIRNILNGERASLSDLSSEIFDGKSFRLTTALSLHESTKKVATSSGMPLRILNTMPTIASVNGELKVKMGNGNIKTTIKAQPLISMVHTRKMELWCPIVNTGVESLRSVELNLPIDMDAVVMINDAEEKVRVTYRVPDEKTRILGLHTLPVTFVREYDAKTRMHGKTQVLTFRNIAMEQRLIELHPRDDSALTVSGHYHQPTEMTYAGFLNMLLTTENHVQVDFERTSGCPKEVEMIITSKLFENLKSGSAKPRFEDFYENNKKFQPVYDDDFEDQDELENNSERSSRLNNYLSSDYKPRASYRHFVRAEIKTIGGRDPVRASTELTAVCDSQMSYCKINGKINRTPMLEGERRDWNLKMESQILLPEFVRDVAELNEKSKRHNKLATTLNVQWGTEDETQKMNLKLQGERAVPQKWIKRSGSEWRSVLATAFINKYDLVADYQVTPEFKSQMEQYFSLLKWYNYWNIDSSEATDGRSNEVYATMIIDPRTRQHYNVSIRTPTDKIRFTNIQLPWTVKPVVLVRPQEQNVEINSFEDMMTNYKDSQRAECRLNGDKVKTFDGVTYKSPIGKCYSVIAKDCAKKSFAVLMKTIDEDTNAKNIKIVTRDRTIEVELKNEKLIVKVNDEKISSVDRLRDDYDIEYSEDFVRCTLSEGVSVRFDGKQATVKLSNYYKNAQCGLCGEFNGEEDDEFRKNDNSMTDDVKEFHRSFTMDDKCKDLYEKDDLFGFESSSKSRRQQSRKDSETEWENDEDLEDYEMFDRKSSNTKDDDEDSETMFKRTPIQEYQHKICFSLKPVQECRRGYYAEKTENKKVPFTCLNRSSPEARRLLRQARNSDISSKLTGYPTSFAETVKTVSVCA